MMCKYVFLKPMQVLKSSNQFLFDSFVLKLQIFFFFFLNAIKISHGRVYLWGTKLFINVHSEKLKVGTLFLHEAQLCSNDSQAERRKKGGEKKEETIVLSISL